MPSWPEVGGAFDASLARVAVGDESASSACGSRRAADLWHRSAPSVQRIQRAVPVELVQANARDSERTGPRAQVDDVMHEASGSSESSMPRTFGSDARPPSAPRPPVDRRPCPSPHPVHRDSQSSRGRGTSCPAVCRCVTNRPPRRRTGEQDRDERQGSVIVARRARMADGGRIRVHLQHARVDKRGVAADGGMVGASATGPLVSRGASADGCP